MTLALPTLDAPPTDDRFLRSFWRLARWAMPARFRFFGVYEYRIAKAYPGGSSPTVALGLQATEDTVALGLDDIPKVAPWPGLAGSQPSATEGARVLVAFINGSAGRPFVTAWAPAGDAGWLPAAMSIDATGAISIGASASAVNLANGSDSLPPGGEAGRVVRYGETVSVTDPMLLVTVTGPLLANPLSVLNPISKVRA